MKPYISHALAVLLGMLVVIAWPRDEENVAAEQPMTPPTPKLREPDPAAQPDRSRFAGRIGQFLMAREMNRDIKSSDLDAWIEGMGDDPAAKGRALAIAGLLTQNPDLIRQAMAADPHNPHILFMGANFHDFGAEEKVAITRRLMEADPDNALAAYMAASQHMTAGNQQEAMAVLKMAESRHAMNDYTNNTLLWMEEAYLASGMSKEAARVQSSLKFSSAYLGDMLKLEKALKSMQASMGPDEASESRRMAAIMGYRLANQSRHDSLLGQSTGLRLELATLEGLPDDAPSQYEGLSIGQARENILAEQERLRESLQNYGSHHDLLNSDPELMQRYLYHYRMAGGAEAARWLHRMAEVSQ